MTPRRIPGWPLGRLAMWLRPKSLRIQRVTRTQKQVGNGHAVRTANVAHIRIVANLPEWRSYGAALTETLGPQVIDGARISMTR